MSNLRAREALERLQRLFLERPSAARKATSSATAVWRGGLRCEISGSAGEKAVTDMPGSMGGEGTGPNPGWLFRASMASCTATAIAARAALQGIELREIEVSMHSEFDARGAVGITGVPTSLDHMRMTIRIGADNASEAQLRELAALAEKLSTVSSTLRERPPVAVEVSVV